MFDYPFNDQVMKVSQMRPDLWPIDLGLKDWDEVPLWWLAGIRELIQP